MSDRRRTQKFGRNGRDLTAADAVLRCSFHHCSGDEVMQGLRERGLFPPFVLPSRPRFLPSSLRPWACRSYLWKSRHVSGELGLRSFVARIFCLISSKIGYFAIYALPVARKRHSHRPRETTGLGQCRLRTRFCSRLLRVLQDVGHVSTYISAPVAV